MANPIAEAPVRPKNTHVPANPGAAPRVSPGSGGSQPAAEPPDAAQDETQNLIQQALKILESTLVDMERIADESWVNGARSKVVAAQGIACAMVNSDQAGFVPDTAWGLQQINEHLRPLSGLLCQATGNAVPVAASLAALVDFAAQYSERLHAAICSFPAALEDLRQLITVAGAKPYRDRPTPPIRRDKEKGPVTAETPIADAGEMGTSLLLECTWDIAGVAEAVTLLGDELGSDDVHITALLRCYGTRIAALNSVLMEHLSSQMVTVNDVHRTIYCGAKRLPKGEPL